MRRIPPTIHPAWMVLAAASLWATASTASLTSVRRSIPLQANQKHYHDLAERLLDKHHIDIPFDQSVLYPGFVAAVYALSSRNPAHVRQVQSLLTGLLVLLVGILGSRQLGPWPGALCAVATALPPILPLVGSQLVPTIPALTILMAAMLLLQAGMTGSRSSVALAGGLLAGLAACFQSFLLFPGLVTGLILTVARSRRPLGLLFLGGLAILPLVVGSWTKQKTGRFVPLTENSGLNLFLGWNPSADGTDPFFDPLQRAFKRDVERSNGKAGLDRALATEAMRFVARCPHRALLLTGRKLALFLDRAEPGNNERPATIAAMSPLTRWAPGTWLVMALAVAGLFWRRPRGGLAVMAAGLVLGSAAVNMVFFSCARFRLSALPGFAILAGALWDLPLRARPEPKRAVLAILAGLVTSVASLGAQGLLGPTTPEGLLVNEGVQALQDGRRDQARALFESAVLGRPDDLLGRLYLARIARNSGQACEAVFHAAVAVLADPTSSAARKALRRLGREAGIREQHLALFGERAVKGFEADLASFRSTCQPRHLDMGPARQLAAICSNTSRNFATPDGYGKVRRPIFLQGGRK